MTRIAVILAFAIAACDVGSVVSNNQGGPDGSIGGGADGSGGGSGSGSNCDALSTNLPDGHHNAGQACMQGGCHLIGNTGGANVPAFAYGGTLYRDSAGTNPYPGATIEVTIGGQTKKMVTGSNGNFYITSTLASPPTAAMTATTKASACPSTTPMSGALVDNGGNCNNCHKTGGTTTPIYLQ